VPLLKPDIVVVMFFMGNDLIPPRPMVPYKNLHHITNAGWLCAFDEKGNYMSPQQAYDYYLKKCNAAYREDTGKTLKATIRKTVMRSVIGTYSWVYLSRMKRQVIHLVNQNLRTLFCSSEDLPDPSNQNHNHHGKGKGEIPHYARRSLTRIKRISERHGARFMLFLIPVTPRLDDRRNSMEHNLQIFEGFNPFVPDFLTKNDFKGLPSQHLNNSGHRKYAEFILRAIESGSSFRGQRDV